jgi:hypothetical protein
VSIGLQPRALSPRPRKLGFARLRLGRCSAGAADSILAKTLHDAVFCKFLASQVKKIPLFSMANHLAVQIFPNFFLAETGKINELRAKKFGFIVFWILRPSLRS